MEITVTGRKMQVTDPIREYAIEKISNALDVFAIDPLRAEVVLQVEKNPSNPNQGVAEVTVRAKGHVIRAEEAASDMYAAIDLASEKVERQMRKYKTKVVDRRQRGSSAIRGVEPASIPVIITPPSPDDPDPEAILRKKTVDLVPLDEDAAMLQMDLVGHDFFMFINDETGDVNVLYRREAGGYGLLEPAVEEDVE